MSIIGVPIVATLALPWRKPEPVHDPAGEVAPDAQPALVHV